MGSFNSISVLVPTRKRVSRLCTMLDSFERTATAGNADVVFRVDDDDRETIDFLEREEQPFLVGPRFNGYLSMPRFVNELYRGSTGDVLLVGNDDMIFHTPDWPTIVLQSANQYPDGLFDIGVHTQNAKNFVWSIVSRKAADCLGWLWDPRIFWGDVYLRDMMAHFDRAIKLPSVYIEHDWAGKNPDQVFKESDKHILKRDLSYWQGTHARAVRDGIEKLKALCEVVV